MTSPVTDVLREALRRIDDAQLAEDLLYLEQWERAPQPGSAAALRIVQLRRANPALAEAIRSELDRHPRPYPRPHSRP